VLPKIALARDGDAYRREMMALIARVHDTHANLWSSMNVRPPVGACRLPVGVRFVAGSAVVWDVPQAGTFERGDVITSLDGVPVASLVENWKPYYAASNEPTRLRDMGRSMTQGACGETKVKLQRDGKEVELSAARVSPAGLTFRTTHDLPGDAFQILGEDVAYLKLSATAAADVARYVDSASKTKGLIIDIRNYPKEFLVFTLGSLLVDRPTDFAMFTSGDLVNPGAFRFRTGDRITPKEPRYAGKIVVLVDEVSQSQAEYTAMAFRAAGAKVIGSTTAGADGNVSAIPLPGGLRSMISGIGVFYPDKKPTQRVGIVPDIEVKPTIAGIRAGRDESLDEALKLIRGN
jgi:C-terminal processing protease CtpA/Prc